MGSLQWSAAFTAAGATSVVNAGVGGTTAQLLARFATDVPADSNTVVLFEWINDAYQGVSPTTQAANWRELVTRATAITPRVFVLGPVPLNEHAARAIAQEDAAAARAGTSVRVLQLERTVADLSARVNAL